jgi:hypothetical protein
MCRTALFFDPDGLLGKHRNRVPTAQTDWMGLRLLKFSPTAIVADDNEHVLGV